MPMFEGTGQYSAPDKDMAYVQGFSERAFSLLESRHPELLEHVATFKVLEADLNTGRAVGAFILTIGDSVIYVPVVAGNDELRPLIMLYQTSQDRFLPLTKAWLNRVMSEAAPSMGDPALQPPTLNQDVSMRDLVRPPNLIGRFAYAADESYALKVIGDGPNHIKTAYANVLKNDAKLLQHAVDVYGLDNIKVALHKHAEAPPKEETVVVFEASPKSVDTTQFKSVFGKRAPEAYTELVSEGMAIMDGRNTSRLNSVARLDVGGIYQNITEDGVFEVVTLDGKSRYVFAIKDKSGPAAGKDPRTPLLRNTSDRASDAQLKPRLFLIDGDMNCISVPRALGRPMQPAALEGSALHKLLFGGNAARMPRSGDRGFFVYRRENGNWAYTDRVSISNAYADGPVDHYVTSCGRRYVRDKQVPVRTFSQIGDSEVTYIPASATFIAVKGNEHGNLVEDPGTLHRLLETRLTSNGATRLKLVRTGSSAFSLDGMPSVTRGEAAHRMMVDHCLGKADVIRITKIASERGQFEGWVTNPTVKQANPYAMQGQDPYAMQGQDPYAMQGQEQGYGPETMGYGMQQGPMYPVSYEDDVSIDPALMQLVQQAQVNDPAVLDAAVIATLSDVPELKELVHSYVPNIRKALDNLGRILLAIWIHNDDVRDRLGDTAYTSLEDSLMNTFRRLGEVVLQLNNGAEGLGAEE